MSEEKIEETNDHLADITERNGHPIYWIQGKEVPRDVFMSWMELLRTEAIGEMSRSLATVVGMAESAAALIATKFTEGIGQMFRPPPSAEVDPDAPPAPPMTPEEVAALFAEAAAARDATPDEIGRARTAMKEILDTPRDEVVLTPKVES